MCLDAEMIVMLFLVWIVAPMLLIAGAVYIAVKVIKTINLND